MELPAEPGPTETVTVSVEAEIPASAERAWATVTASPTPSELTEHPMVLQFTLPGTPSGAVGEVACSVHRHADGTHCTNLWKTLELEPGRRHRARPLTPGPRSEVTIEVEQRGPACIVRYSATAAASPEEAPFVRDRWSAALERQLWRLRRFVGDPSAGAAPPPRSAKDTELAAERAARHAASRTDAWVDVTVHTTRRLDAPTHAVWPLVADPSSGVPWLRGGIRFPVPGSPTGVGQLWGTFGETAEGAWLGIDRVVELVPRRRVVSTTPFDDPRTTMVAELRPRVMGSRLDVRLTARAPRDQRSLVSDQCTRLVTRFAERIEISLMVGAAVADAANG